MNRTIICAFVAALLYGVRAGLADVTHVTITTNVVVADISRLGVNLGGDTYYDSPLKKVRDTLNFEGLLLRQCHLGNLYSNGFGSMAMNTNQMVVNGWAAALRGGAFRILGGPAHNTTGTIVAVTNRFIRTWDDARSNEQAFFVFDRTVALPGGKTINQIGLLTENTRADQGSIQREYASYWMNTNCTLQQGDISPDSWGLTALRMSGRSGEAYLRMSTSDQSLTDNNGAWQVCFRAKALTNTPIIRISIDFVAAPVQTVTPVQTWQSYTQHFTMAGVSGSTRPTFFFRVNGGDILIDDLTVEKTDNVNSTDFLDDLVNVLSNVRPGIVRQLQMGGSTVSNSILPRALSASYRSSPSDSCNPYRGPGAHAYGLHQFYGLCETIDAEPWFCLPGTLNPEEMAQFMEYVGAPTNVGMGALRAGLGHAAPWTRSLRRIHVEFGNEAWNWFGPYVAGGFNRMDYWSNLIAVAKSSPYYTNNVVFHAAGQNFDAYWARAIIRYATNCDRYAIAPYILHELKNSDLALNNTDEKLFRWLFAYPLMFVHSNGMPQQLVVSRDMRTEYSIYEINHHITGGDASAADRNKLVASLGGGLSVINTMLALLKNCGIRSQCFFTFSQQGYNYGAGIVKLWGAFLSNKSGEERYRPTALGLTAVNRILGGDLVQTIQDGENPMFQATGNFNGYGTNVLTVTFPVLHTYAVRDGGHRGLIIINLDVASNQTVALHMPAHEMIASDTVQSWLLTSSAITNNNEFETGVPQVTLTSASVLDFTNGVQVTIPPFSMQCLSWQIIPEPLGTCGAVVCAVAWAACVRRGYARDAAK